MILDLVFNPEAAAIKDQMVTNNAIYQLGFTFQFNRHRCGGDYLPFTSKGIKAIAAHQENHAFQHTPDDKADKITLPYAIKIARLYLTALVPLAEPVAAAPGGNKATGNPGNR